MKEWLYILAIALQVAGAVLLIIKYWGNTQNRIINEYFPGTGIANNDGNDNAVLEVERVRECVREIYASRIAFTNIALGYALAIFGDKGLKDNIVLLTYVALLSSAIIVVELKTAKTMSNRLYKDPIRISYNDLPDYISGTASIKDIENLFK